MNKFIPFLLIAVLFSFSSCKKETVVVEDDPALAPYFGTWEFTKTRLKSYYEYIPTGDGESELVLTEEETVVWERVGAVSMGRESGELKIDFGMSPEDHYYSIFSGDLYVSDNYFYATVDDNGNLTCTGNCETIPYVEIGAPGSGPSGHHQITNSTYSVDLGWDGSAGTNYSYDIAGEKL